MATTSHVMLIKPNNFYFNAQTAKNNAFQHDAAISNTQKNALFEFESLVEQLTSHNVSVTVFDDIYTDTPDSIFPNNWISTHQSGKLVLYPMFAPNRQKEVRADIVEQLTKQFGYKEVVDFTRYILREQYLEGTGSLVLDRNHRIAYACKSIRTNEDLLAEWATLMNYKPILFHAFDNQGTPIYHTNVMMAMAQNYTVICLESISEKEQTAVKDILANTHKQIVEISHDQMNSFAGNMLELQDTNGHSLLLLSQSAYDSLSQHQKNQLSSFSTLLPVAIPTIETLGGGSIRCMIAEIFKPV